MKNLLKYLLIILLVLLVSCVRNYESKRGRIDLSGSWYGSHYYRNRDIADTVHFPGAFLKDNNYFYNKNFNVPEKWRGKRIKLYIEKCACSSIYIDGKKHSFLSRNNNIPVNIDLTAILKPGKHNIAIEPESNENIGNNKFHGFAGDMYIEASDKTYIDNIDVSPDIKDENIRVRVKIKGTKGSENIKLTAIVTKRLGNYRVNLNEKEFACKADSIINFVYGLKDNMHIWQGIKRPYYSIFIKIKGKGVSDTKEVSFAVNNVSALSGKLMNNGKFLFLKGVDLNGNESDSVLYMTRDELLSYFSEIKKHGYNCIKLNNVYPTDNVLDITDRLGLFTGCDPDIPEEDFIYTDSVMGSVYGLHPSYAGHKINKIIKNLGSVKTFGDNISGKLSGMLFKQDFEEKILSSASGVLIPVQDSSYLKYAVSDFSDNVFYILRYNKFVWRKSETFKAKLNIVCNTDKIFADTVLWKAKGPDGTVFKSGIVNVSDHETDGSTESYDIEFPLSSFTDFGKCSVSIFSKTGKKLNSYNIWVYEGKGYNHRNDILVTQLFNKYMLNYLNYGGKVLLMPKKKNVFYNSVSILDKRNFVTDEEFNNINFADSYSNIKELVFDASHPVFKAFPTESFMDYQWWNIAEKGRGLILDKIGPSYKPIVSVRNGKHNTGFIFEFKLGKGKLLVCMSNLYNLYNNTEAVELFDSMINYMSSPAFNPSFEIDGDMLKSIIRYTITK